MLRDWLQDDLERLKPLINEAQTEHRLSCTWRVSAMGPLALALAARDAAGQDLVDATILEALPHWPTEVAAVLHKAGPLAPDFEHGVAVLPHA
ncbi:hypothetical protein [Streptomyces halstedii]|uniref:hypothetical protein n=1 Tax=Streptomyces halstedii TaxID=1944 RepID=UPI0036C5AA2B